MKYQIGDEIIVLHSNEEGHVIDIIDDKMVMIEVRGVKFPAYMDQIDFPYFLRFTKDKNLTPKPKVKFEQNKNVQEVNNSKLAYTKEKGVWIAIVPKFGLDEFDDEIVNSLQLYLINQINKNLHYTYSLELNGSVQHELESSIISTHQIFLQDLLFEHINDSPNINIEFKLSTPDKHHQDFFETQLKLKPKQVFQKIEQLKQKNEDAFLFKLFDEYPTKVYHETFDLSKLSNKGFKVYDASKIKDHLQPAQSVVDLHIEKIIDDSLGKSNLEILTIQLETFEKWYHLAVVNKIPKFTVIHGVGKGKLKEEIHQLLKVRKEVKTFINQYHEQFGFGATEIFFNW
jgi:hypothetical protein